MCSFYRYNIGGYLLYLGEENNYLTYISLNPLPKNYMEKETPFLKKVKTELEEYFKKERTTFDLPVKFEGTAFQKKVWRCMQTISYGTTLSYQELAIKSGHPKACRAVGNVCHNNKILIVVPCHRVVAKNHLGGFGCDISLKIKLLSLEGSLK